MSCDRTFRNNLYSPLIQEEAYKVHESKSFLQKLYGNSLQGLVTTLYGGAPLTTAIFSSCANFWMSWKRRAASMQAVFLTLLGISLGTSAVILLVNGAFPVFREALSCQMEILGMADFGFAPAHSLPYFHSGPPGAGTGASGAVLPAGGRRYPACCPQLGNTRANRYSPGAGVCARRFFQHIPVGYSGGCLDFGRFGVFGIPSSCLLPLLQATDPLGCARWNKRRPLLCMRR